MIEFDRALVTASYFGFRPIIAPKITKRDIELTRNCGNYPHYDATEKASIIRTYLEEDFASLPHPIALVYEKLASRKRFGSYALHFIGSSSGIAEATLIRATLSILSEEGHKNLRVDINCIGDRESINTYERELINYMRKFGANSSNEWKQSMKEDIFNLFRLEAPEALRLREMAPSSLNFLSLQSRIYFKEVLEYIEALGIEFRLAPELVGERNHTSHTIFAIRNIENEDLPAGRQDTNILAIGYRYSRLARFFGLRKEIPMAGVSIFSTSSRDIQRRVYKELPKPKFYLIQLGKEAKIKTLSLIELLRSHRIPMYHFLGKDKITTQLLNAENLRVPYLIIIGQKEALDGTATIRNVTTRAQDTVKIESLPRYLKNITL
ncbi:MAG: His/Gly/Thr/Pro-type tRNA ligase C-terminal domain-containing protein [Patescibacteria group bacterium]|nr:His/Gly/Thr/Pro-type tRNA ligase C-terminal domain-containing protein [Patescibacteria group bacterium]